MMDVQMPQLGETVTEGTITRWCKRVGDPVRADEPLFEVSTDKVDSEVPAPAAGVLTEIRVAEGDTVAVGTVLAVIDGAAAPVAPSGPPVVVASTPVGADAVPAAAVPGATAVPVTPADARFTSPVVRRLVAEHGLDPAAITGSGIGGRVTRADVLEAVARRGPAPSSPPPAPAPVPGAGMGPGGGLRREAARVPLSVMRVRIAEHMIRSHHTSAHAYTSVEVDFERVARVRAAQAEAWKYREGFSLTYLPFVARAVSDAIDDYPVVNASIDGDDLVLHPALDLAVAVDLAFEGLIAPVVRGADGKRLRQIAREVSDLATRARAKQLSPDEVQGGTFTITNPGPYGSYQTLAIINQPQVAILATDGIAKRVTVRPGPDGDDVIAVRHTGLLTLGWDHRAFDGAYAAAFLNAVRDVLEHRDWETELE
ncbi:MAG: 2-oxo acid dehydrogenase subunit E2 [Actinobacteria bacterium]|nr:2-oxo acid dehydrogenase subunit E2 [Actinomycetota bacterium]